MQAYGVRVYGRGACIVCCLCTVVRNVYGMFNTYLDGTVPVQVINKSFELGRYGLPTGYVDC